MVGVRSSLHESLACLENWQGHAMEVRPSEIRDALVDDQALVRDDLAARLASADSVRVVGTAATADEALRCAEQLHPDVLLMDVLPETSVCERAGDILRLHPQTKVIMLDESPVDANIREALRIQATGYLTKQQP